MFKTMVTILVSLVMTASAAVGLNIEDTALMTDIRSRVEQSTQVETAFDQGDSGLSAGAEGSAEAETGFQASRQDEDDQGGSAEGNGEAEASARAEAGLDLSFVKKLWNRVRARLEAIVDRVQEKAEEIEFEASVEGEGSGSLEAEAGGAGSSSVDGEASGSGEGSLSIEGEEKEDEGFTLPFLGGSSETESESESGLEVNFSGQ